MNARRQKAHDLADRARITFADGCYSVPSQSGGGLYTVILDDVDGALCDCPDFELRGGPRRPCKHILACRLFRDRQARGVEQDTDNTAPSPKPKRLTYPQSWPEYNAAQMNEGRHFSELLASLCRTVEEPPRKPGRGRKPVPLADQVHAATLKIYTLFSGICLARLFTSRTLLNTLQVAEKSRVFRTLWPSALLETNGATSILLRCHAKNPGFSAVGRAKQVRSRLVAS